ncbi:helix-turn-helix domain-containing protein [Leadbettera azotonutricia]|uniref:Helix-turn-helix domain protein n=1 Tax=Leadbettera azotonutricia (strain ATCC BAA-888 / DSM 13862 / ZAS-9) TaxID=545695 RepID=F5YB90_LEAAZ|nr:helix-turn-helix transcriptional regulator [Leadbettera azotonutricia]AEF80426.1 helix-turn-helix domain protein [Leadbettera azotonutricia ZAS-9]
MKEQKREIHERIIEVRKALGLSQKEFGKRINVSQGYFSNIELQERKINDRIILLICSVYGVNEDWLKNGAGEMFNNGVDLKIDKIVRDFRKLDGLLQDYVMQQIDLAVKYHEKKNGDKK